MCNLYSITTNHKAMVKLRAEWETPSQHPAPLRRLPGLLRPHLRHGGRQAGHEVGPLGPAVAQGCPCPYNSMSNGRQCGARSAYAKPGGYSPLCYPSDVSEAMIAEFIADR